MARPEPFALLLMVFVASAARPDESKKPPADPAVALIDKLVELDRQDTGYSGADSGSAFLPLGRNERGAALLSPRQGKFGASDAMKSLVNVYSESARARGSTSRSSSDATAHGISPVSI